MYVSKMIEGKRVEVPIDEVWDAICRVIQLAQLLACPAGEQYQVARLAYLTERLNDLDGLEFNNSARRKQI